MREIEGEGKGMYEVEGGGEAALDLDKLVLAVRRVTAEGEDVVDAIGVDGGEGVVDAAEGHVGAGEVHHGLDADHVLHAVGDLEGEIGGGSTGAPCDVAEGRAVGNHPLNAIEQIVHSILGLRGEELEREHHAAFAPDLVYHLHLHNQNFHTTY